MKNNIIQFGENVEGYEIPVLNEREIRASAGILFLFMFISLMQVIFTNNFILIKYAIIVFLVDLIIRIYINPKYSPLLIIGRLIVNKQTPELVGAPQKLFAWKIGLVISSIMFFLVIILNSQSEIVGLSCLTCLIFLFFESAFGICLGCKIYSKIYKEKALYCPGDICEATNRYDIQKTNITQISIVLGLIIFIIITAVLFNETLSQTPKSLWEMII